MSWLRRAACRGIDPALFYPEKSNPEGMMAAKEVCARCPVRNQCLDAGMREKYGVWGGTTEEQRRKMRRGLMVAS